MKLLLLNCLSLLAGLAASGTVRATESQVVFHSHLQSLLSHDDISGGHLQFHSKALELLSSLKLPETCLYSSLTESLIQQCSTSPQILDGHEKAAFATKLAVCEFKAAKVDFPRQCKGELASDSDIQRCIAVLESRPQWWTSWSNCLQSVATMCQSVRSEREKDNLIELHSNLTTLYTALQTHLHQSLGAKGGMLQAYKSLAANLGNLFDKLMRTVEDKFSRIHDLVTKTESHLQNVEAENAAVLNKFKTVEDQIDQGISKLEEYRHLVKLLYEQVESHSKLSEDTVQLANQLSSSLNSLNSQNNVFSAIMQASLQKAEHLEGAISTITSDYSNLASTFERFSAYIEASRNQQTKNLQHTSMITSELDERILSMNLIAQGVLQKLDLAGNRIERLGHRSALWDFFPIFLMALVLSGKRAVAVVLLIASFTIATGSLLYRMPKVQFESIGTHLANVNIGNLTDTIYMMKQKILG